MASSATKDGSIYTDYGMTKMGFVEWCPHMYLLEDLRKERQDVLNINPHMPGIHFVSQLFVVEKTEEVIRNLL